MPACKLEKNLDNVAGQSILLQNLMEVRKIGSRTILEHSQAFKIRFKRSSVK